MEKKKLLLVAISTGLFLVLTIGAAIVVFAPGNAAASSVAQARQSGIQTGVNTPPVISSTGTASPDPVELVRPNDIIPSPQPFLTGITSRETESNTNSSSQVPGVIPETETVTAPRTIPETAPRTVPEAAPSTVTAVIPAPETLISVQRPSAAAVPNTAPAGRAATTVTSPAPAATRTPATVSTAVTTAPPAAASTPAAAPATVSAPMVTSTPATASAPATANAPASTPVTADVPSVTAVAAVTEASTAAVTASTTTTGSVLVPAVAQAVPVQTRINNDFWIQAGAFSTVARAEAVKDSLASKGIVSLIENLVIDDRPIFRVRVGPYTSLNEANYWLYLIQSIDGFEDSQIRQTPRQG